ncbi:MAG: MvaI/BcnI family restriction endonuclease [Terracidiphilus sp.]
MTPEPTEGVYSSEGVEAFIRRFGYRDREVADRRNFGGIHNAVRACAATGLVLTLVGYDGRRKKITDPTGGGIALLTSEGEIAAKWPYTGLLAHWNRKHARAAYVPSTVREERARQYRFGSRVRLGTGTDFLLFLDAVSDGAVYYDPGIKMENASTARPQIKRRSQFRIKSAQIPLLYRKLEVVDLM